MKILALLSSILSLITFSISSPSLSQYALIRDNSVLYVDENVSSALFSLPENYFVQILEENDGVYKVSYLDVVGFVKAESMTKVDYVPLNKFPSSVSCVVLNDGNTVTLRSSPFVLADNIIDRLDDGESVTFYGAKKGDEQVEKLGDTWYYIKNSDGKVGYVYSLYVTPPAFPENDYLAQQVTAEASVDYSLSLSSPLSAVIIALLSLLFIALLLLALRPKSRRD